MLAHLVLTIIAATAFATPLDRPAQEQRSSAWFTFTPGLAQGQYYPPRMGVPGGNASGIPNDAPVYLSSDTKTFLFLWKPGPSIQVLDRVVGAPYRCLDAGEHPKNGVHLKVSECQYNAQQTWYIHDNVIELVDHNLCVDVPEGNLAKGYLQLWGCGRGNPNQVFHLASW